MFIIPLLLTLIIAIILRKYIKDHSDLSLIRNRKANKVARKRLKAAMAYAQKNDKEHFYDEILRTMWTYVSDKLNIPTAELDKDNIAQKLASRGVSENTIVEFRDILNTAEFARFAPSDAQHSMKELYDKAASLISEFENTIK
jgi:hypothetical protein